MSTSVPPSLTIRLLGPFEVLLNGAPLPPLRSRKGQGLLALLVLRGGAEVDRSWLAATLGPDSAEPEALANLRTTLWDLRRALGTEARRLHTPTARALAFDLDGAWIDVHEFDAAAAQGDLASLSAAVDHYRGPFLEGSVEEWALPERERREQAFLRALETLARHTLAAGDPATAEGYLRRILALDPLRETAWRSLMQALADAGSATAALVAYRDLQAYLERELGTEPDPETVALYETLRTQANESDLVPAATASLTPPPPTGTITFLFTDLAGSTRLWEEQPDVMGPVLTEHDRRLRHAIEAHDGHVFKTVGDAFCAAFATAPEALETALAIQRTLREPVGPSPGLALRVRAALHTGSAERRGDDYFGPPLNRVARILDAAHGSQILLSQAAQELVRDTLPDDITLRDLGEHRLKDLGRPERIYQAITADLPADFPPLRTLDARHHNLPLQRESLLGRKEELAALRDLVMRDDVGLVTLTGPGGTGKTRLGLQITADLLDQFPHGACFVDLSPLREPDLVLPTIAHALGLRESASRPLTDVVRDYLREKQMLLLLDNFEQVLPAAPGVADLLANAPGVKVLVTSRERLRLRGEREFPVDPLPAPDWSRLAAAADPVLALSQYAAVELFIKRADAVRPRFTVTNETAPAVAEICHRLDGLPLAIELAAARVKLLSPQALLARLGNRLSLLTGGARDLPARQQTLRSTIQWSYDLLSEEEQQLYRELSVFVGGFTLEAAEAVCSAPEVLDGVASLVEKNLVRAEERVQNEPRFGMLETIREFAGERLQVSEEASATRWRHTWFFVEFAEIAERSLSSIERGRWLHHLDAEHGNLRAVLDWSVETGQPEAGLRVGSALEGYWGPRGHWREGHERLTRLLALPWDTKYQVARWKALHFLGNLSFRIGDFADADHSAQQCLALAQEIGAPSMVGRALHRLGGIRWHQGRAEEGEALLEEALLLLRKHGQPQEIAEALNTLGMAVHFRGDNERAAALWKECISLRRALGDEDGALGQMENLGCLYASLGQYDTARGYFQEALALFTRLGDRQGVALCWEDMGGLCIETGEYSEARRLLTESLALYRELGAQKRLADSLNKLGVLTARESNLEQASSLFEEALTHYLTSGDRRGEAITRCNLGLALNTRLEYSRAVHQFRESLAVHQTTGYHYGIADCLAGLGGSALALGDAKRAVRLMGAAAAVHATSSRFLDYVDRPRLDEYSSAARISLGEDAFAAAWAEGQALSLEEVIELALSDV